MTARLKRVFLKALFVILICLQQSCLGQNYSGNANPYKKIAENLVNNKIIMLEDFHHDALYPYTTVLSALEEWYLLIKDKNYSKPVLDLVLERNAKQTEGINAFFNNNNLDPYLEVFGAGLCLEDIYFLDELRTVKKKFEEKGVVLNIVGFEENRTEEVFFSESVRERDLWFVHKRDSLTFENAKKYITDNPSHHYLFYYGGAHLAENKISKNRVAPSLSSEEAVDYYLAHYLVKYFGKYEVIIVSQQNIDRSIPYKSGYLDGNKKVVMFSKADSTVVKELPIKYTDYSLFHRQFLKDPIPLYLIFSKKTIAICKDRWMTYDKWSKEYNKKVFSFFAGEFLRTTVGIGFRSFKEFTDWADTNKTDQFGKEYINSLGNRLYERLIKEPKNDSYRKLLAGIGFGPGLTKTFNIPKKEEWDKEIWPVVSMHYRLFTACGLLWFGNDYEKQAAKKFLNNAWKINYDSPGKYLEYWYNKYDELSFN
jgi:hypothetical protein